MSNVRVTASDSDVRTIAIDREERRNALDRATLSELEAAFEAASADSTRRSTSSPACSVCLSPAVVRLGKEAVYTMCEMDYASALRYLREMIVLTSLTHDAKEGVRAFFEKRKPVWKGR